MRWIHFSAGGRTAYGIHEGDAITETEGNIFGAWSRTGRTHAFADVKIEIPLIPRTFYCAGLNYVAHIKEGAAKRGETPNIPERAEIGYRAQNALIAHGEDVVIPHDATEKIH